MDNNQPASPRRRLQALLAIPDSQRTEEQWDEIVELEIQLAPGNRENGPGRDMRMVPAQQQNRKPGGKPHGGGAPGNKPAAPQNAGKPMKKPRNKPRKPKAAVPET